MCYAHVGEPKNINGGRKILTGSVCLFTREQSDPFVSLSFQNQWTGYKEEQQTQVKREYSLLTFLEKLRNTVVNIHLLTSTGH